MTEKSLLARCETPEFLQLSLAQMSDLLVEEKRTESSDSEEKIFSSVIKWLEHNKLPKEQCLPKLLPQIHIEWLSFQFIVQNLTLIAHSEHALELVQEVREKHLKKRAIVRSSSLLVIGYEEDSKSIIVEKYCPDQKQWQILKKIRRFWVDFGAACVNNVIYIFGGWYNGKLSKRCEALAIDTKKLTRLKHMKNMSLVAWPAIAVMQDKIYVIGGEFRNNENSGTIKCINLGSSDSDEFVNMGMRRHAAGAATLDGCLYVVGGCINFITVVSAVERYDFKQNTWISSIRSMAVARDFLGVAAHDGHIYAVGGMDDDQRELSTVERYSPKCNSWVKLADLTKPRRGLSCISFGNRLLAVGGFRERSVEEYNADTNEWTHHSILNGTYRCVVALTAEN